MGAWISSILLFLVSIPLLWINEGCSVKRYQDLKEGAGLVQSIESTQIKPELKGSLVHVSGQASTQDTLQDQDFGIVLPALALHRQVLTYLWQETKIEEKVDDRKVVRYTYQKIWSSNAISSERFHEAGHSNPQPKFSSQSWQAQKIQLGDLNWNGRDLGSPWTAAEMPAPDTAQIRKDLRTKVKLDGPHLYLGQNPAEPAIGDQKIVWSSTPAQAPLSVIGALQGTTLVPFATQNGGTLWIVKGQIADAKVLFNQEQSANTTKTWLLRLLGTGLICLAFVSFFNPLIRLCEWIPLIGDLLGAIVGVGAMITGLLLGVVSSLSIIAVAWFWHRPVLSLSLLAGALCVAGLLRYLSRAKSAAV